jgi:hypothetical protein
LNVFLQYKRPEYLYRAQAGEWSAWGRAYFRFWITAHQQSALEACANSLGANGLVAYASPAFYRRSELWTYIEQRTLIVNTHFAPAIRVSGHGRYTYVDATTPGKAHSRISEVPPLAFLNGGGRGGPPEGPPGGADGRTPQQLLKEARRAAKAALGAGSK